MGNIILGVIVGFLVWSVLWVGSDAVFSLVSPDWGKTSAEFQAAAENKTPYALSSAVLLTLLIKSFIVSIISGFVTALIAKENSKSTLILGVLLLVFGIFIQSAYWNYMPLWYHDFGRKVKEDVGEIYEHQAFGLDHWGIRFYFGGQRRFERCLYGFLLLPDKSRTRRTVLSGTHSNRRAVLQYRFRHSSILFRLPLARRSSGKRFRRQHSDLRLACLRAD
jgi:hypothetical protein